jgi:hypothetical protein
MVVDVSVLIEKYVEAPGVMVVVLVATGAL